MTRESTGDREIKSFPRRENFSLGFQKISDLFFFQFSVLRYARDIMYKTQQKEKRKERDIFLIRK